jgi:hypothetical protein
MFQLLGLVLVAGGIIIVAKWLLIGAVVLWVARMLYRATIDRWQQHQPEHAAIAARADQQHRRVQAGDHRGLYGDYPPAV